MRSTVRVCPGQPNTGSVRENGALAQLGERLLCKQDVVGSIPSGSTISFDLVELVIAGSQRYIACESKETKFADLDL